VDSEQWSVTARSSGDYSFIDCAPNEGNYLQPPAVGPAALAKRQEWGDRIAKLKAMLRTYIVAQQLGPTFPLPCGVAFVHIQSEIETI
jgi:hypothetical protein